MPFPYNPRRIPDETSVDDRLRLLNQAITEEWRGLAVQRLAARARTLAKGSADPRVLAAAALVLVQQLPYRSDPAGQEWFQSLAYTARFGGDCEDLAQLFVGVCVALGLDARLVWITQRNEALNHVTAAVVWDPSWDGDARVAGPAWDWADASILGAWLGENPYHAVERLGAYHVIGKVAAA